MAAEIAAYQGTSEQLQSVTRLSELQSNAFVADYGLPDEYPKVNTIDDIIAAEPLARSAISVSAKRPDACHELSRTVRRECRGSRARSAQLRRGRLSVDLALDFLFNDLVASFRFLLFLLFLRHFATRPDTT